jgi:hypothetical protein
MVKDKRYKVDQSIVNEMRLCRESGMTYQAIADLWEVSYSTSLYWCNTEQREKQRAKNAKRIKKGEELERGIKRDIAKRRETLRTNDRVKLRHQIQTAISEKRCNRKTVQGIKMETAKKLLKSGKLNIPNAKIQ